MSTFGERLRREREMRNISLDDIAATTKVGTRLLRALEDEQFDQLPGGIFNKGYVRAVREVRRNRRGTGGRRLFASRATKPPPTCMGMPSRTSPADSTGVAMDRWDLRSTFPVVPVLIVLALIAGIIGGWRIYREHQLDRQSQTASTPAAARTIPASSLRASIPATSAASTPQTVSGKNVNGRGRPPLERTQRERPLRRALPILNQASRSNSPSAPRIAPGFPSSPTVSLWFVASSSPRMSRRFAPPARVVFWTGNAGAVEVSFNGKNVPLSGGENDERVLVFNSHGVLPGAAPQ